MKVLKFGGSSVGSAQGLRQVRRIVAANDGQIVVVVSALGGITDRLLATAAAAAAGKPDYTDSLAEIVARHRTTIDETVASERRGAIRRRTDELLDELANILRGVYLIRDLSPRTGDAIVSYGERLSSGIVAAVLEGSRLYDAREFIRTKTDFGKHIAEPDLTEKLIRERLADRPRVSVVPGFIASDCATGDVTNLGRGGSDYTAALIAAALNAETLTACEMNTRAQCQEYVAAFRKYLPGMEHCRLVSSGYKLGIRDTRHLVGEHILTAEEVLGAVKQPDTIARGAWPCEMHTDINRMADYLWVKDDGYYDIPLRCLKSRSTANLWGAGRLVSADAVAFASVRVMGIGFATGQAAGVAAAFLAAGRGTPVSEIQAELRRQGACI